MHVKTMDLQNIKGNIRGEVISIQGATCVIERDVHKKKP